MSEETERFEEAKRRARALAGVEFPTIVDRDRVLLVEALDAWQKMAREANRSCVAALAQFRAAQATIARVEAQMHSAESTGSVSIAALRWALYDEPIPSAPVEPMEDNR